MREITHCLRQWLYALTPLHCQNHYSIDLNVRESLISTHRPSLSWLWSFSTQVPKARLWSLISPHQRKNGRNKELAENSFQWDDMRPKRDKPPITLHTWLHGGCVHWTGFITRLSLFHVICCLMLLQLILLNGWISGRLALTLFSSLPYSFSLLYIGVRILSPPLFFSLHLFFFIINKISNQRPFSFGIED